MSLVATSIGTPYMYTSPTLGDLLSMDGCTWGSGNMMITEEKYMYYYSARGHGLLDSFAALK